MSPPLPLQPFQCIIISLPFHSPQHTEGAPSFHPPCTILLFVTGQWKNVHHNIFQSSIYLMLLYFFLFYSISSQYILRQATRHAEIEAIDMILLDGGGGGAMYTADIFQECTLYVTCEPCIMCAAALAILIILTLLTHVYSPYSCLPSNSVL